MTTAPILLVDDSPDDVYLTIHAFRRNNIDNDIVVAGDGAEAIDLLEPVDGGTPLRPVMVLLDINMPRMGGLEVLAHLRASPATRYTPVIMLTTSVEDCDIADSYAGGANGYVAKPVTADEFAQVAKALGAYWLDLNLQVGSHVVAQPK